MDKLDVLINTIKTGEPLTTTLVYDVPGDIRDWRKTIIEAYHGSLDAAIALHEALLPGVGRYIGEDSHSVFAVVVSRHGEFRADGLASMSRAWLLAILKAYRAIKEIKTEG